MWIFGGLRPIFSRLVLDIVTILLLVVSSVATVPSQTVHVACLASAIGLTLATAGVTGRWTLFFPMVPIVIIQLLRRATYLQNHVLARRFLGGLNLLCLLATIALCILFPAMELPPIEGRYSVGLIDLHLPVNLTEGTEVVDDHIIARILYPTEEPPDRIPYVRPNTAIEYLRESMKIGAPPPLQKHEWMLHNWLLVDVPARYHAKPAKVRGGLPVIVYSHGLGGVSTIYSYQTMSLAANGYVVVAIDHTDGSAPYVQKKDGKSLKTDHLPRELSEAGKVQESVSKRRDMTEHRAAEMIATLIAAQSLNEKDIPELDGVSFVNMLNRDEAYFMGHSFGGATALTAGLRRPELVQAILAHEPATDWTPDDVRRSLFPGDVLEECPIEYDGGTGGLAPTTQPAAASILDVDLFILFSHEWYEKKWGGSQLFEWMHQNKKLTPASEVGKVEQAHHQEFSDMSMMTPLWLARGVGLTGPKNPHETGEEIRLRTLAFLQKLRSKKK